MNSNDIHQSRKLAREKKQKRNHLAIKLIRILYKHINGIQLSLEGKNELNSKDPSLTYGEVVSESFLQILDYCNKGCAGGKFVDLGCGTGKAVICAALSSLYFDEVIGIEILPSLCISAISVHKMLSELLETVTNENYTKIQGLLNKKSTVHSKNIISDPLPDTSFIEVITKILIENHNEEMRIERLAELLCGSLGHKTYRSYLKQHKSLSRFLQKNISSFTILKDDIVILNELELKVDNKVNKESDVILLDPTSSYESTNIFQQLPQGQPSNITAPVTDTSSNINNELLSLMQSTADSFDLLTPLPEISIILGDIFIEEWWKDADIVYTASLLFSEDMMSALTFKVICMKPHSWFITLKPLLLHQIVDVVDSNIGSNNFDNINNDKSNNNNNNNNKNNNNSCCCSDYVTLIHSSFYKMSWRMAKVYFYRRNNLVFGCL